MIAPGKLAPRAAAVAAIRKEITSLRAQLKSTVAANLPPTLAADLPLPLSSSSSSLLTNTTTTTTTTTTPTPTPRRSSTAASSSSSPSSPPSAADRSNQSKRIAGLEALLLVEQQLSVASSGSGSDSDGEQDCAAARARSALLAVEQNLAMGVLPPPIAGDGTDELAEFETLQQENELLKEQLDSLLDKQRRLSIVQEKIEREKKEEEEEEKKKKAAASEKEEEKAAAAQPDKKKRTRRTTVKKDGITAAAADGGDATVGDKKPMRATRTVKKNLTEDAETAASIATVTPFSDMILQSGITAADGGDATVGDTKPRASEKGEEGSSSSTAREEEANTENNSEEG